MKQVILFSELESKGARRTAWRLSKQGNLVYALAGKGEDTKEQGIYYLETDRGSEEDIRKAISRIPENYLDLLVISAGKHCAGDKTITEPHDYEELLRVLNENVVSAFLTVNAALPLLRAGKGKRIAVLTEEKSSINLHRGEEDYGYQMSLASLNMMERILFNALRPEGFTFRNYAESEISGGMGADLYLQSNLCYDANDAYIHSDENRLVMRNAKLCELPW